MIESFGVEPSAHGISCAAECFFKEKYAKGPEMMADVKDIKYLCYDMGYCLGNEVEGVQLVLNNGTGRFTFRDFTAW